MRLSFTTKHPHRAAQAAVSLVAALCLVLLTAASASAGDGFATRGSMPGQQQSWGVAVDDSSGDVLVTSGERVLVYDSGGSAAVALGEFGEGVFSSAMAIAVDQSSHAVYVTDAGSNRIERYTSAGPPAYTLDKAFASPAQGSADGQIGSFASSIAVDPTNHDLLVADTANKRVSRYKPNGEFVSSFDASDSAGGAFISPQGITVDPSGGVYVVDGEFTFFRTPLGNSRVIRFSPAGEAQQELGGGLLHEAGSVAFDSHRGDLVVLAGGGQEAPPLVIYALHGGTLSGRLSDPEAGTWSAAYGLTVDNGASGHLYTVTHTSGPYGVNGVQVFDPVTFPTLAPPTAITIHGVHLSGEVTPEAEPATAHFEYSTDQVHWTARPSLAPLSAPGVVSDDVTGLLGDQKYYVRLVSASTDVTTSLVGSFTTPTGPPEVVTLPAVEVSATRASLRGTINANGLLTSYHVEYGTTEAYGSRAPASFEAIVGQLRVPSTVDVVVEGLSPVTTYHYRVVATSAAGTTYGPDQLLTTVTTDGSARAFEQVTPVEKGGP
jgi:sugar lactone lactonase YvrE